VARVQPKEVFARNVRAERERQGLSQEALADRADGLDAAQLRKAELATYDPQLLTIVRIARGLGVPAAELLKGL
jgi:transcriptional regulator with XRE-family HTH domain